MTQEEKQLLFKDLCARLPYDVKCHCDIWPNDVKTIATIYPNEKVIIGFVEVDLDKIKPYLRPMSSMTEEEKETYQMFFNEDGLLNTSIDTYLDWLLEGNFDFSGLIPMGLALEAPKEMYNV